MIVNQSDTSELRSAQDKCSACRGGFGPPNWGNTVAHIDTFNSSQTCDPTALGDYGNFTGIRLR